MGSKRANRAKRQSPSDQAAPGVPWLARDTKQTLFGVIGGALIGLGLAHLYYKLQIEDFKADVEVRKKREELMLRGVESNGKIEYSRNAMGEIVGVNVKLTGAATGSVATSASLSVGSSNTKK
jgi:hypothetical protein